MLFVTFLILLKLNDKKLKKAEKIASSARGHLLIR